MNRLILLIAGIILLLTSCDLKKNENVEFSIPKQILDNSFYRDSNYVVTNFKQGAFNIHFFKDSLSLSYNSFEFLYMQKSSEIIITDTSKKNYHSQFQGYWTIDKISELPIISINNNYIRKINKENDTSNSRLSTPYNFDWDLIKKDRINGFVSFSNPFRVKKNFNLIALNLYTKGKYSFSIYLIPRDSMALPKRLITFNFSLIGFGTEFENGKIKNIKPNIIVVEDRDY